jgi:hypothetical protein
MVNKACGVVVIEAEIATGIETVLVLKAGGI